MALVKDYQKRRLNVQPANLRQVVSFSHSFETNEQGDVVIYFPYACTVNRIRAVVSRTVAGTDAGTITPKNHAGTTMTGGTITVAASAAVGTEYSASPTANNTVAANEKITLTSAKTTAGGRVYGTVEVTTL